MPINKFLYNKLMKLNFSLSSSFIFKIYPKLHTIKISNG